jgi:replicative DNA helicase
MTAEAFGGRCLTDEAWHRDDPIAYKDLRRGGLSEPVVRRLYYDGLKKLEGVPLYIDEQSGLRISEIISRARRHHQFLEKSGNELGLVIIDHLGKIRPSSRYAGNNYGERSEISAALAEMAKSLNVPVLALHQLSRAVEQREDTRPLMRDLRDSGRLEEDADNIMFVYRDAYYLERVKHDDPEKEAARENLLEAARNKIEIIVAKQRAGQTGAPVTLFADMQSNAIRDLAVFEGEIS